MKVLATNIAQPQTIIVNGKEHETGIYKFPVDQPVRLETTDVKGDYVSDRKVHGGMDKACYIYSAKHYPYWQSLYENLEWDYGMFGENLTIENMDERNMIVGSKYRIGQALVQVTQPRQPCFKFAYRFQDPELPKKFVKMPMSGVYLRVLEEGEVQVGDQMILDWENQNGLSIADICQLYYMPQENDDNAKLAMEDEFLPQNCKEKIGRKYKLLT